MSPRRENCTYDRERSAGDVEGGLKDVVRRNDSSQGSGCTVI